MMFHRFFNFALSAAILLAVRGFTGSAWCAEGGKSTTENQADLAKIEAQLARKPGDVELQYQHAEMMGRLQRYEDEVAEADQMLKKNPKLRDAYLIKAHGEGNLKKYGDANLSLDKAFALGPPAPKLLMIKAGNLKNLKLYPQAVELLNQVIKLCPTEANAYGHRSQCYYEMYGPSTQGLRDLETYSRLKPSDTSIIPLIQNLKKDLAAKSKLPH